MKYPAFEICFKIGALDGMADEDYYALRIGRTTHIFGAVITGIHGYS
jgi:hypothetical protein